MGGFTLVECWCLFGGLSLRFGVLAFVSWMMIL